MGHNGPAAKAQLHALAQMQWEPLAAIILSRLLADSAEGRIIEAYCRAIGVNSRSKARSAILRAEGIYANGMQLCAALCCACGKVAYRCCYALVWADLKQKPSINHRPFFFSF